jgi:hypothetical protein
MTSLSSRASPWPAHAVSCQRDRSCAPILPWRLSIAVVRALSVPAHSEASYAMLSDVLASLCTGVAHKVDRWSVLP